MFPHMKRSDPFPKKLVPAHHGSATAVSASAAAKSAAEDAEGGHDFDDDSEFTLLSENSAYSFSDDEESSSDEEEKDPLVSLTEKLEALKKNFAARDKLLARISRGKSKAFVKLLHQHEVEVRAGAQERLLVKILFEKAKAKGDNESFSVRNGVYTENENTAPSTPNRKDKAAGVAASSPKKGILRSDNSICTDNNSKTSKGGLRIIKSHLHFWPKINRKKKTDGDSESAAPSSKNHKLDNASTDDNDGDSDDEEDEFVDAVSSSFPPPTTGKADYTSTARRTTKRKKGSGGLSELEEELIRCRAEKPKGSILGLLWETLVFELRTTIPAILSLILYCVAHIGIYQGFSYVVNKLTEGVYALDSMRSQDILNLALFALGVWLIRLSGYLYWFLNPSDYDCVKFDFHNRLRLGKWDARCLLWIVNHDIVRGTLFTAGYYLSYIGVDYFHDRLVTVLFDETDMVMENLPSRNVDFDMCLADLKPEAENSTYSFSCQHEMDRLQEKYQAIKEADVWYTYSVLSTSSYEGYWFKENEGLDAADAAGALLTSRLEFVVYVGSFVLSLAALTAYGFVFWYKY